MSLLVSLSDYQVRDLNDDINKLMGQKYHWERRIKELGGADYTVRFMDGCCMKLSLTLGIRDLHQKC